MLTLTQNGGELSSRTELHFPLLELNCCCLFALILHSWSKILCCVSHWCRTFPSALLVSRQDEARWADPPCCRRSPLPPFNIISDLRLQQSPLRQWRQQMSHPGKGCWGFPMSCFWFLHLKRGAESWMFVVRRCVKERVFANRLRLPEVTLWLQTHNLRCT